MLTRPCFPLTAQIPLQAPILYPIKPWFLKLICAGHWAEKNCLVALKATKLISVSQTYLNAHFYICLHFFTSFCWYRWYWSSSFCILYDSNAVFSLPKFCLEIWKHLFRFLCISCKSACEIWTWTITLKKLAFCSSFYKLFDNGMNTFPGGCISYNTVVIYFFIWKCVE